MATPQDRAAVVAHPIMRIFTGLHDPDEQRRRIEQLLRDEFYDERTAQSPYHPSAEITTQ